MYIKDDKIISELEFDEKSFNKLVDRYYAEEISFDEDYYFDQEYFEAVNPDVHFNDSTNEFSGRRFDSAVEELHRRDWVRQMKQWDYEIEQNKGNGILDKITNAFLGKK